MSFILILDVIALRKYISYLSLMFNSVGNSPIFPSSAGFIVEIGSFNIVLIIVNCVSVSSLISSLLMYPVLHPYKNAGSIVVSYSFINVLVLFVKVLHF